MPHSAKDAKGGNFFLPRRSWMDSAERVPVAVLGFLGSVVSQDYKPEISPSYKSFWYSSFSKQRKQLSVAITGHSVPAAGPSPCSPLPCTHPLLSCSSLLLTSLLKAPWWFLFWSLANLKVSQGAEHGYCRGTVVLHSTTVQRLKSFKKPKKLSKC